MNVSISGATGASSADYAQMSSKMDGRLNRLFSKFDTNGDGVIDKDELAAAQQNSAEGSRDADLLASLTTDSNGSISQDDFKTQAKSFFQKMRGHRRADGGQPPDASEMFSKLDANGDGKIDEGELGEMAAMGPDGGPSASELLKQMDTDGNGSVSEDEFKAHLEKMKSQMMSGMGPGPQQTGEAQAASGSSAATSSADQLAQIIANAIKSYSQTDSDSWSLLTGGGSSLSSGGLYV